MTCGAERGAAVAPSREARTRAARERRYIVDFARRELYGASVPTLVHADFEWDADKAVQNVANHDVTFEEAALAMTDSLSIDFYDLAQPQNIVTLAMSPGYPVHCQHRPRQPNSDH